MRTIFLVVFWSLSSWFFRAEFAMASRSKEARWTAFSRQNVFEWWIFLTTRKPRFYDCVLWLWMIKNDTLTTTLCSENGPVNADKMTNAPSGHTGPLLFPTSRSLWILRPQLGPSIGTSDIWLCQVIFDCYWNKSYSTLLFSALWLLLVI
jgi:hypothetical protein